MEVHGCHLSKVSIRHVNVETLGLANIGTTCNGKVNKAFLWDFPNGLI
jgi:hypothetical protein